jgi:2-methylcitrate dehydratase PrpD
MPAYEVSDIMITKTISEFSAGTRYADLPADAIVAAKKGIIDFLGVAIAGSTTNVARVITEYAAQEHGASDAGIIAGGIRTSPYLAALCNGAIGHALDFDDECESWNSHPTTAILPAVLALAEKSGATGQEVLTSYVVGWEVAARIGAAVYRKTHDRGSHNTPLVGTLAAAAAGARLLKLNTDRMRTALGISASQAAGLQANVGTETKPLHAGLAASNGVRSAQLAQLGLTANVDILDDPIGYLMAVAGKDHPAPDLTGLGTAFDIAASLCIKVYPSCYNNQRPLDSMFHLIKEHEIRVADIAAIDLIVHPHQIKVCRYPRPRTGLEGKFSLTYSLAAPLIHGKAGLDEYSDAKVLDPRVTEFLPRINVVAMDPKVAKPQYSHCDPGQLVTVKLKSGKQYSYDAGRPKGHATNPLSWEETSEKFRSCTAGILSTGDIARCIELVDRLDKMTDVSQLMTILAQKPAQSLL